MLPFELPVAQWISAFVDYLLIHFYALFNSISGVIDAILTPLNTLLTESPEWAIVIAIVLIAWWAAGRGVALFSLIGLLIIDLLGMWEATMDTFALVLSAEIVTMVIGLPLGVLVARSDLVDRIIRPLLDFMQTMPAFVYLIPAVMFFGLGTVPGVMATVVFCLPPLVRLTNLGIRQVPADLVEAGRAFGTSDLHLLLKVQIPMARSTIMAGINQSIMLALSMVVIAAMIGAGGLGGKVLQGIGQLRIGLGFVAGISVVILAIVLDRVTQALEKGRSSAT